MKNDFKKNLIRGGVDHSFTGSVRGFVSRVILNVIPDLIGYRSRINKTVIIGRVKRTDNLSLIKKEAAGILGSCVASPRMTVEKGYCHLEPRAIARGCKDLINKCRDCIELTRLKQVRIKLKRDLYGDFACAQPLKMTMIICFVLSLGVASESRAATTCAWAKDTEGNDTTKLVVSGSGAMSSTCSSRWTTKATEIEIEKGVTTVTGNAFNGATKVTKVTIPDSVTTIGEAAFSGMSRVTSLTIPDSVTTIGNSAFSSMFGVTSLTISDSVTSIGEAAFSGMSRVTSLTIPDSVTTIGNSAFSGMSGVTGELVIPDSVTTIGNSAFSSMFGVTSLTISDSVTSIGEAAFSGMSRVTSLTIPDSVTSIGEAAFSGMSRVTSLTIPDSVTTIGKAAFSGMSGVTSLTIPDSVDTTKWNIYAFGGFPTAAEIVCLGVKEECYKQLAKYFKDDGSCPPNITCSCSSYCISPSKIKSATKGQCPDDYGWSGIGCTRKNDDGSVSCASGYVDYKNECWDVLPFAKKRYTPAEAAQWLNEDDNTITLTFKKQ